MKSKNICLNKLISRNPYSSRALKIGGEYRLLMYRLWIFLIISFARCPNTEHRSEHPYPTYWQTFVDFCSAENESGHPPCLFTY